MIIVQEPWSTAEAAGLDALLGAALRGERAAGELVVLPLADPPAAAAPDEPSVHALLAAAAHDHGIYLAAAACVREPQGPVRLVGWLVGPEGTGLLRTVKILPELVEGYADASAAVAQPAPFAIARTPHGQLAILIGEDATAAPFVRAAMFRGAELVLNPAREALDEHFSIRQQARMARAYENHCYLVTASPRAVRRGSFLERLPGASATYDEWAYPLRAAGEESFVRAEPDLEGLRRRRAEFFGNLCVTIRPTLYAPGYREAVEHGPPRAPGAPAAPALGPAATPAPATRIQWLAEGTRRARAYAGRFPVRAGSLERYDVVLGQVCVRHVTQASHAAEVIEQNLSNALATVMRYASAPASRLVVFPEFFLQGSTMGRRPDLFPSAGIDLKSSAAMDRLAAFAQKLSVHVAGAVLEIDPEWPGYLFNTAFILDEAGNLIHRYRKIQCADVFGFMDTTPGSILERYLDRYGYEGLFPVADTKLGRLATAICFDMNFPELHRALAQRGAEVLLHPTAEPHNVRRRAWENSRQVRAWENTLYIASAGHGGEYWDPASPVPSMNGRGHSRLVNFDGSIQVQADGPGDVMLQGQIDLAALRAARADARTCQLLWDEPLVYLEPYARTVTIPDNLKRGPGDWPYHGGAALKEVIERFTAAGIFVAPAPLERAERPGEAVAQSGL